MVQPLWKTVWWFFKRLNKELPYDLAIVLVNERLTICSLCFIASWLSAEKLLLLILDPLFEPVFFSLDVYRVLLAPVIRNFVMGLSLGHWPLSRVFSVTPSVLHQMTHVLPTKIGLNRQQWIALVHL